MVSKIIIISIMVIIGIAAIYGIITVYPDILLITATIGVIATGICAFMALTCDYED